MADSVVSSAFLPQPAASFRLRWDVFLSFRGEDTRHTVVKLLYDKLEQDGVRVFRDDDGLARGDEIAPSLIEAIEDSAASIVILSPRYATSHWCLEELTKIVECRRLLLPVFFRVDPNHVRRQRGTFGEPFRSHEERFGADKVGTWRRALEKVGSIAGWVFNGSDEKLEDLVHSLAKRVSSELSNTPLGLAPYTVGLDFRIEEVEKLLDVKSNGVRLLVLHGLGGVGKTTLAKALFNRLVGHFEHRSFIPSVREVFARHDGLVSLQNQLISDISPGNVQHDACTSAIKRIFHGKRILVVLDDVDDVNQLDALGVTGKNEWFHEGSRIVITTRDRELVSEHQVSDFYEVKELHLSDSLKLFSYHALRREQPTDNLRKLSKEFVSLTGGLPLALEVFGSFLFDKRRIEEWKDALEKLKVIRPQNLQGVLRISFDGLDEEVKSVFLDIACFFGEMRMKREDAIDVLKGCGFRAEIALTELRAKSLIKITEDHTLWMHDQLRDMGRQIVRHENYDPGMRSRLWDRNEIMTILKNKKGTRCIQGITLDFKSNILAKHPSAEAIFRYVSAASYIKEVYKKYVEGGVKEEKEGILFTKPFEKMVNLRLLKINHAKLEGRFQYLPGELRWLQWKGCPLKALPPDFCPRELAVLDLSESKIEQLWGRTGWYGNKVGENLRVLNLYRCYSLTNLPAFSGNCTLEKIVLEGCKQLTEIHKSIGKLKTLLHLNLRDCVNLIELPSDVSGLKNLQNLILSGCIKLKSLPETICYMTSLKELLVDDTSLEKLPESIFHLTKLETLNLNWCQDLKLLPDCMGLLSSLKLLSLHGSAIEQIPNTLESLGSLEKLSLARCRSLTAIPDSVEKLTSLIELTMSGSAITELPAPVCSLSYLKYLWVDECKFLTKLPDSVEGLASIRELHLDGTSITSLPEQIGELKILVNLQMKNCEHLTSLPESIGNVSALTTLNLFGANIVELPESIGMLENLTLLNLNKCRKLRRLPASIGQLKALHRLLMEETAVTELPDSFGMIPCLQILKMAKRPHLQLPSNSGCTGLLSQKTQNTEENQKVVVLPNSFSQLSLLEELDAPSWNISAIHDDFGKLASLEILNLEDNRFCSFPSSLRGLSKLRKLNMCRCDKLVSLPLLPLSLVELNVADCAGLESIADISDLVSLEELDVTNCEKLVDIPDVERLKSLRRLYMCGCNICASVVKRRLSKVVLKKIRYLSMPGREIPDWFCQEPVIIPDFENIEIKAVVIGVVISVDQQLLDGQHRGIFVIQVEILELDEYVYRTTLNLKGVPKTNEDHLHLCRFASTHPLILCMRKDYKIRVIKKNSDVTRGVELKKWGIHLVFENDDDFDGDEQLLNEDRQSVSEKLAKFVTTS